MHPLNETVQGLVTDVLCVTHLGSVYLFYVTHYKNTADFLQKARSKSLAKNSFSFTWGRWANIKWFEEPHYRQGALFQWREDFRKLPLYLEGELVWLGPPFISEGDSWLWLYLVFFFFYCFYTLRSPAFSNSDSCRWGCSWAPWRPFTWLVKMICGDAVVYTELCSEAFCWWSMCFWAGNGLYKSFL